VKRTLFLVSDRTGITVDTLVHTLMTQFDDPPERRISLPFVDNQAKVIAAVQQINRAAEKDAAPPLVFSSLIDAGHREELKKCAGIVFDFFDAFLQPLSTVMGLRPKGTAGLSHGMGELSQYDERVDAVNFALNYDDGVKLRNLERADIILIGVSRSGKTPTCLYLAMHYGVRAANYPLTEEDFERHGLPEKLREHRHKLFGLTIAPERLQRIREERRPGSVYASLAVCRKELIEAENLFKQNDIPYLESTAISIEEMAAAIMHQSGIKRRIY
jgi:regulator of PEP synthase PpsR (kinase-PPPase family)